MNSFEDLGFAKLDHSRPNRTGIEETVFCLGKSCEQLQKIFEAFIKKGRPVLGTRCTQEQFLFLKDAGLDLVFDPVSKIIMTSKKRETVLNGVVAICSGGTADIPVAEEAAKSVEFFGATANRHYDIGVAGIHRLLSKIDDIKKANVVIAVAGMEGALGSVIAGLVSVPILAVPTSVGYGASFGGLAPLLTMLNSCAEGISVVNIDNGYGAAVTACRILRGMQKS